MAPLLSAAIQSTPAIVRIASICTVEIMPRSPTITSDWSPNCVFSFSTCGSSVLGSAALPSNTDTETGQPRTSVMRP